MYKKLKLDFDLSYCFNLKIIYNKSQNQGRVHGRIRWGYFWKMGWVPLCIFLIVYTWGWQRHTALLPSRPPLLCDHVSFLARSHRPRSSLRNRKTAPSNSFTTITISCSLLSRQLPRTVDGASANPNHRRRYKLERRPQDREAKRRRSRS